MALLIRDRFPLTDRLLAGNSPEQEFVSGTPSWNVRGIGGAPAIEIVSNEIKTVSDSTNRSVAYINSESADGHISVNCKTSATTTHRCGVAFRYVDDNNHYLARINYTGSNNVLLVQRITGGSFSALAAGISVAGDTSTFVEVKVVLSGDNITVYVDGVEEWTGTDNTHSATSHGVYLEGTTVRADDFLVTDDGTLTVPETESITSSEWVGNMKIGSVRVVEQAGGGVEPAPTPPVAQEYQLGFNMNDPRYFQTALPYKNIASHPSWIRRNTQTATFGADGYPDSGDTYLFINTWGGRKCPVGVYEITHSGSGTRNGDTFLIDANTDSVEINFNGEVGSDLEIRLQGDVGTYTDTFANRATLAKVVRFMDFLWTNIDGGSYDGANPTVRTVQQPNNLFKHIVASADDIADMALEFDFDPWVCMHFRASEADVTAFAQAMSAKLSGTGRKVYVEYANEAWNGQFPVTNWIDAQVANNAGRSGLYADLADRNAEVFKAEFLAGEVVGVLASQLVGTGLFNGMVNNSQRPLNFIDAVSPASYIGGPWARKTDPNTIVGMTDAQILSQMRSDLETIVKPALLTWKANGATKGWRMITYEAGLHLEVANPNQAEAAQNRLYAWNDSASAGVLYDEWLDWYEDEINDLNTIYMDVASGQPRAWGHKQYELDPATPRWQSVLDRMAATA